MPRHEASYQVGAPPLAVWGFIRDFEALCACIPGVERVLLVDERTADLTVTEKIGVVPLTVALRAQIDEEHAPYLLAARAAAEHLTMAFRVTLQANGEGCEMTGVVEVSGAGPLKPVVDRLFERRARERAAQFGLTLTERFRAAAAGGSAGPPATSSS
ncbi:MAG: SRPBCC family protein [Betaproteobacteria bacterium]|nr:SRPBCC family protein [Betaproteobacteria bacterium]